MDFIVQNLATPAQQWAAECSMDYIRGQVMLPARHQADACMLMPLECWL
jgi:hypothetical protein